MDKIILTDCDGVLVEWHNRFHEDFPKTDEGQHPMDIFTFNQSITFGNLYPYKDSVEGIKKLKEDSFKFFAITSSGTSLITKAHRRNNLDNLFGVNSIDQLLVCELHSDKGPLLEKFKDTGFLWIEDSPKNAMRGKELGLTPLLMNTPNNIDKDDMGIQRVDTWEEIIRIANDHYS
jgi:uncharacterized HAD superfamily protein